VSKTGHCAKLVTPSACVAVLVGACGVFEGLSGGAPPTDADGSTATPRCPPGTLLCFDYETGGLPTGTLYETSASSIDVTEELPHGGSWSMKSGLSNDGAERTALVDHPLGSLVGSGTLAVRVWLYMPPPAADATVLELLGTLADGGTCDTGVIIATITPAGDFGAYKKVACGEAEQMSATAPRRFAFNEWNCLELSVDGSRGQLSVGIGGERRVASGDVFASLAGYNGIELGVALSVPGQPYTVFYDDVTVATVPLPCP
jgi:hypothetical protein